MSAVSARYPHKGSSQGGRKHALHVGFVPLIDAAPLIVAAELGYFADEGLDVHLDKQIGWGNVRDRLTYGQLHASHAPLGMAPASIAGMDYYDEPLAVLVGLGSGGNAITVSTELAELGDTAAAPALWRRHLGRPVNLAYVFSVASHHYMLRGLLQDAGLQPDRDAKLCVMPPPQMTGLLQQGTIDGYCAGEPWGTLAMVRKCGTIIRATTELFPDHPEKVLAVTRKWYGQNPVTAERLVRATLRGCDFCENIANRGRLTEILARPAYLALDEKVIAKSLSIDEWLRPGIGRPRFRSFARKATVPRESNVEWLVKQMIQWDQLPATVDVRRIVKESIIHEAYELANFRPAEPQTVKTESIRAKQLI